MDERDLSLSEFCDEMVRRMNEAKNWYYNNRGWVDVVAAAVMHSTDWWKAVKTDE